MPRRLADIWRLVSSVGDPSARPSPRHDFAALADIFNAEQRRLRTDSVTAARQLRTLTIAVSHPVLFVGAPMTAREIVLLLLNGIRDGDDGRRHKDASQC